MSLLSFGGYRRLMDETDVYHVDYAERLAQKKVQESVPVIIGEEAEAKSSKEQQDAFVRGTKHLSEEDRDLLWALVSKYERAWLAPRVGHVGYKVKFEVTGKPFKARFRHYEPSQREELSRQIEAQLALGVMRSSKSEWAASPHMVPKKIGEWRVVLDYRQLNKQMVSDAYPIPRLWTNLRTCAGRNYYVTLDMNKGFWNIPLEEESADVCATQKISNF
ncbi:putative RNA-directed DNA polymerase [Gregarina niphandrodes]|uniref:RNA-directed DNA polymerase n=1 Tax=Gregarina niphandrodes TaxID=110365 RepID=A0A023B3W4_GRENI|nr:putative RNA-directed DNA polymerase [Gregarina niphandrodes]EZG55977.1 putative RNA-directed DNA polymerase [Gregarina niphandrodes]|eukprot:XP_011131391.1 putative RNA-directed DNA polymerase [Gregarina niphandrodes]